MRLFFVLLAGLYLAAPLSAVPRAERTAVRPLSPFMDDVERRAFLYFWNEADPKTGLTKNRTKNAAPDEWDMASVAASGFGLSALCIGAERGWITRGQAEQRALTMLRFLEKGMERRRGVFRHWVAMKTGETRWNSELSTIDTALALAGALTAGQYFGGDVRKIADRLYRDVDWAYWSPRGVISHGSRGEVGQPDEFLRNDYGRYNEAGFMHVMAIGSPTHPIPPEAWYKVQRPFDRYGAYSSVAGGPLFLGQYPNLWVDFRGVNDGIADYHEVLRVATLANRQFCIDQSVNYKTYGPDSWGLTAGDGPDGYRAWAAPPGRVQHDGTVNPHAAGGSFFVAPDLCERAMRHMKDTQGDRLWGRYGLADGYNLDRDWFGPDVLSIDLGATLLSIENHRSDLVRRMFMSHPDIQRGMRLIGFRKNPASDATPLRATPLIVAPAKPAEKTFTYTTTFHLPAQPAWTGETLFVYGGVAVTPVSLAVNDVSLGTAEVDPARPPAPAFAVPARALRWGSANTLRLTLGTDSPKTVTYGPVLIGPRAALEFRPLAIDPVAGPES